MKAFAYLVATNTESYRLSAVYKYRFDLERQRVALLRRAVGGRWMLLKAPRAGIDYAKG